MEDYSLMATFSNLYKFTLGAGAFGGTWYLYKALDVNKEAYNSWTTNYSPSVKWDDNWDHRSPTNLIHPRVIRNAESESDNKINEKLEKVVSKASRHLILIRHGQYNMKGETDLDRYLTPLGRDQAEHTGKRLKALGFPYTLMIKSTMTRAQETGDIINKTLGGLPVEDCNMIREGAPIPPEPPVGHWRPEAQQFYEDGARIEAAFRKYFYRAHESQDKDTYTLLVCHANVIRYFVCRALQFPPEAWLRLSLYHGSITWITITPKGRVILRTLGDSGHIPADTISY
ncbi:hypothetical protein FQR65_LT06935 [Abscondita terminalis]|nr:hypothetical protein FQR65_LT06935 [Abscondita terminalis]